MTLGHSSDMPDAGEVRLAVDDAELFACLGFRWDRERVCRPVDVASIPEVLAAFDRDMAGHVWAAAVLEGNPFTYPEVQTLLEGITVGGHKLSDEQQILRLRDGYVLVRDLVRSGEFRLTKQTSDEVHAAIAREEALEWGHFRGEGSLVTSVTVNLGRFGTHEPPATTPGGANLREIHCRGLHALEACESPFERASAYFLFAAANQLYFDGNKRTARTMMNGVLLSAGIHAVLVPAQERVTFNDAMVDFYVTRDATAAMDLLGSCGPRVQESRDRMARITREARQNAGLDVDRGAGRARA